MSWLQFDQQHSGLMSVVMTPPAAIVASLNANASSSTVAAILLTATAATSLTTGSESSAGGYDVIAAIRSTQLWMVALRLLFVAVLYGRFRVWMNGRWFTDTSRRLEGRVCIVTGANTGIGLQTALGLAERGGTVWLACRDVSKARHAQQWICDRVKAAAGRVHVGTVDMADMQSVRAFAAGFLARGTRLDLLVNNAGVMGVPPTADCRTVNGHEPHMGVNHYGPFLLSLLLVGRMRRTAASDFERVDDGHRGRAVRIVNVSSCCHRWVRGDRRQLLADGGLNRFHAYAVSKLAGMLATRGLAGRLGRHGVLVNALHPGVVHTEMPRNLGRLSWLLNRHFCALISWLFLRTAESGAQAVLYTALDPNLDYVTGQYIDNLWFDHPHPSVNDATEVEWFWRHSEQIVGLTYEQAIDADTMPVDFGPAF